MNEDQNKNDQVGPTPLARVRILLLLIFCLFVTISVVLIFLCLWCIQEKLPLRFAETKTGVASLGLHELPVCSHLCFF